MRNVLCSWLLQLVLRGTISCRLGTLLLSGDQVEVLGGGVDALAEANKQPRVLARALWDTPTLVSSSLFSTLFRYSSFHFPFVSQLEGSAGKGNYWGKTFEDCFSQWADCSYPQIIILSPISLKSSMVEFFFVVAVGKMSLWLLKVVEQVDHILPLTLALLDLQP